jgi:CRP/FNR family transcriptional regulator, anaerobic regulatory protein
MTQNLIDLIHQIVPFTDEEFSTIIPLFKERTIKKGDFWVKSGEINPDIFYIDKGLMRSYFTKDGIEKTFDIMIENDIVVSPSSFFYGLPSVDSIQAVEDCEISFMTKEDLNYLYDQSAKWERLGRLIFEHYTYSYELRLRTFISDSAQERYEKMLIESPDLVRRMPQIYLANFLGITPQSLSRLRKNMSL